MNECDPANWTFREVGVFMTRELATDVPDDIRQLEVVSAGGEGDHARRWS
jgi:hypothetical protein